MLNSGREKSPANTAARTNRIDENAFEENQASRSRGPQGHMAERNVLFILSHENQPSRDEGEIDLEPWHEPRDGTVVISIMLCRAHCDLDKHGGIVHARGSNSTAGHGRLLPR